MQPPLSLGGDCWMMRFLLSWGSSWCACSKVLSRYSCFRKGNIMESDKTPEKPKSNSPPWSEPGLLPFLGLFILLVLPCTVGVGCCYVFKISYWWTLLIGFGISCFFSLIIDVIIRYCYPSYYSYFYRSSGSGIGEPVCSRCGARQSSCMCGQG